MSPTCATDPPAPAHLSDRHRIQNPRTYPFAMERQHLPQRQIEFHRTRSDGRDNFRFRLPSFDHCDDVGIGQRLRCSRCSRCAVAWDKRLKLDILLSDRARNGDCDKHEQTTKSCPHFFAPKIPHITPPLGSSPSMRISSYPLNNSGTRGMRRRMLPLAARIKGTNS